MTLDAGPVSGAHPVSGAESEVAPASVSGVVTAEGGDDAIHPAFRSLRRALYEGVRQTQATDFLWLYVCGLTAGKKVKELWVEELEDAEIRLRQEFATVIDRITSFDVEFLFGPVGRSLDLGMPNRWGDAARRLKT